jgi:hypothetical protein
MRDFYRQYDAWLLDHLRHDLPAYVHYRNYIRGHRALGGTAHVRTSFALVGSKADRVAPIRARSSAALRSTL